MTGEGFSPVGSGTELAAWMTRVGLMESGGTFPRARFQARPLELSITVSTHPVRGDYRQAHEHRDSCRPRPLPGYAVPQRARAISAGCSCRPCSVSWWTTSGRPNFTPARYTQQIRAAIAVAIDS